MTHSVGNHRVFGYAFNNYQTDTPYAEASLQSTCYTFWPFPGPLPDDGP